jgi:hypothetical protein
VGMVFGPSPLFIRNPAGLQSGAALELTTVLRRIPSCSLNLATAEMKNRDGATISVGHTPRKGASLVPF